MDPRDRAYDKELVQHDLHIDTIESIMEEHGCTAEEAEAILDEEAVKAYDVEPEDYIPGS